MIHQHIDTAPVWEAYKADCECPLCLLEAKSEKSYIESFLGGSVMEPAVRMEVNRKGFCRRHLDKLYGAGNRLGLALMADTHMKALIDHLRAAAPGSPVRLRLGKGPSANPSLTDSCILCERLESAMERYEVTLLHMWRTEPAFREAFSSGKGLCLVHYQRLAGRAGDKLSGRDLKTFLEALHETTLKNLQRVEEELNWFTLKFDYRNQDKPWGNSRDAVERALVKLRGGVTVEDAEIL